MGSCNKKNLALTHVNEMMNEFYFRSISIEFITHKINEYKSISGSTYYDFWTLTKLLGIHPNLNFQSAYWQSAYTNYVDKYSIEGILFVFILLCKAKPEQKLLEVRKYLCTNILHANETDSNIIIHYDQFKKILFLYFMCLTKIPGDYYQIDCKERTKDQEGNMTVRDVVNILTEQNKTDTRSIFMRAKENIFDEMIIEEYVDVLIKKYVKRNYYVNCGKFLNDFILLLVDDKRIRDEVVKYSLEREMKIPVSLVTEEDYKSQLISDKRKVFTIPSARSPK